MKLFVIGANGRTGAQFVDLARARSHGVTACALAGENTAPTSAAEACARIRTAQINWPARFRDDAVLSALGCAPAKASCRGLCRKHGAAMDKAGVKRLVLVSAAVLFPKKGAFFAFFRWLLAYIRKDPAFRAVAPFMLDAVEQHTYLREIVGMASELGGDFCRSAAAFRPRHIGHHNRISGRKVFRLSFAR